MTTLQAPTRRLLPASSPDRGWTARRAGRVDALLLLVLVLSGVDLALTLEFMTNGGLLEQNPLVRWLVDGTNSAWALVGWKALTVGICVGILHRLRQHRPAELASWMLALVLAWLTLRWGEYAEVVATLDPRVLAMSATRLG